MLAGVVAGRRQFCSRLVAQAYRDAGVNLVSNANFCHLEELLNSAALAEVPNVLRNLSPEEEADRREDIDNVQAMRDSTNALLQEARKLSPEIELLIARPDLPDLREFNSSTESCQFIHRIKNL